MKRITVALLIINALSACSRPASPSAVAQASAPVEASAPTYIEDPVDVAFDNAPADGRSWTPPAGAWFAKDKNGNTCTPYRTPMWIAHTYQKAGFGVTTSEQKDGNGNVTSVDIESVMVTSSVIVPVSSSTPAANTQVERVYRTRSDCEAALRETTTRDAPVAATLQEADSQPDWQWKWDDPAANPQSGNWYMANGSAKVCMPMPTDVVKSTERMWADKGNPSSHNLNAMSGRPTVTVSQGGDKSVSFYASVRDCENWLPAIVQMQRENEARGEY